jgi:hypothetical protein
MPHPRHNILGRFLLQSCEGVLVVVLHPVGGIAGIEGVPEIFVREERKQLSADMAAVLIPGPQHALLSRYAQRANPRDDSFFEEVEHDFAVHIAGLGGRYHVVTGHQLWQVGRAQHGTLKPARGGHVMVHLLVRWVQCTPAQCVEHMFSREHPQVFEAMNGAHSAVIVEDDDEDG